MRYIFIDGQPEYDDTEPMTTPLPVIHGYDEYADFPRRIAAEVMPLV